jgi:hypothetical protein
MVIELPSGDVLSSAELDRFLAAQDGISGLTSILFWGSGASGGTGTAPWARGRRAAPATR